MAVHSAAAAPAVGKRLWSYVRAALFMARNGVLSHKRRLLLSMHLLAANKRRGTKALTRTVANLLSHSHGHHGHHGGSSAAYPLRRRGGEYEYEFSCTNSPSAEDHSSSSSSRRRLAYFPCLGAVAEDERHEHDADAEPAPPVLARIQYYASAAEGTSSPALEEDVEEEYAYDVCASATASPALVLLPGAAASGEFSVRVSNYSSEDESVGAGGDQAVDADAEEFIRRFYAQLRRQNTFAAMLPYHTQQQQQESAIAAA